MAPNKTQEQEEYRDTLPTAQSYIDWDPKERHKYVAPRIERAYGKPLPQLQICVQDLNISAQVQFVDSEDINKGLPTLWNTFKQSFSGLGATRKVAQKEILTDVNLVLKPGTLTLVLGQPCSGKSTLLKYLSGRFQKTKNVIVQGQVTYNGVPQSDLTKTLSQFVAYVTQRDYHFPTLTVKETFQFAHDFCTPVSKEEIYQRLSSGTIEENESARAIVDHEIDLHPDLVIANLGLKHCENTVVGDEMLRGVSGGERKRVTTGEMQFGFKEASMMDEISTGLDSAATFDIVQTLQSMAQTYKKTIVIALLQPPPDVFELFDNLILLNQGKVLYQGPRAEVIRYFDDLGFRCPEHHDHADFLLDIASSEQSNYHVDRGVTPPKTSTDFANAFRQSSYYEDTRAELNQYLTANISPHVLEHMKSVPVFQRSSAQNLVALIQRQFMLLFRDKGAIFGRGIMSTVVGLIYGSTYFDIDLPSIQLVCGTLFNAVIFLTLNQSTEVSNNMFARTMFYKQRGANFYQTGSFVISSFIGHYPMAIFDTIVFGTLVYWMGGLVANAGVFIMYLLHLFLNTICMGSYFYFLSVSSYDLNVAQPLTMVSIAMFCLFAGFVVLQDQIPSWLVWIYWINPLSFTLRGLLVNQYRHSSSDVCVFDGIDYCTQYGKTMGEYYLDLFSVPSDKSWGYLAIPYLLGLYFLLMILSMFILEYRRPAETHSFMKTGSDELTDVATDTEDVYYCASTPSASQRDHVAINAAVERRAITPITLAFHDLRYTIVKPDGEQLDLLKGVSGYAVPGTMTALMGSSGAGKTTLMDVIAGRKKGGQIQGMITLNGHTASDIAVRRLAGYCEQMDIHSEASTIRESLMFSARLRQSQDVPVEEIVASVQESLDLLDLNPIADEIVRGRSVEQMKRLTIGVELAAQPSILFLDEPTSGLDARAAKIIMDGVRKVADSGRTIICTIHQPSYAVFKIFDNLLLLKRGGEMVYFGALGHECRTLIKYFESVPGVPQIKPAMNPATWMLECIGAGVAKADESEQTDFVQVFSSSEEKEHLEQQLREEGFGIPSSQYAPPAFTNKRASDPYTQFSYVVSRFMTLYWRTPSYNLTRFYVAITQGLIFGFVYLQIGKQSYQEINSVMGLLFLTTLFLGVVCFNSVLPIIFEERASFYRERSSQTYNAVWYFLGSTVAEIPYVFCSTILFTILLYPMVGFQGFREGVIYWLATSLNVLLSAYLGQFLGYCFPNVQVAALAGVLVNTICFLFMGFAPPASGIPAGYNWLYQINPFRYPLSIVAAVTLAKCEDASDFGCQLLTNHPPDVGDITVKEYVEGTFNMKYDDITRNFLVTIAFIVFFRILALLALRFVNHQKR
uniref:ATPbinding Cassette (ABC) Superfamily putative n=1 Tax=Albugo laibachii Nc14 TaxID=890382 RepID=F0W684_9STRA|nr:ATPbinding Cassette (ABC) Superfamily putative [Albugo laibachii Nc14]|eukprot:CCA16626.1 ATPbinding Cassette (ABC) Superfamily putative [Albugo laibachii Nc14]